MPIVLLAQWHHVDEDPLMYLIHFLDAKERERIRKLVMTHYDPLLDNKPSTCQAHANKDLYKEITREDMVWLDNKCNKIMIMINVHVCSNVPHQWPYQWYHHYYQAVSPLLGGCQCRQTP